MENIRRCIIRKAIDASIENDQQAIEFELASEMGIEMYKNGHYTVSMEEDISFDSDTVIFQFETYTMNKEAYREAVKIIKTLDQDDCRTHRLKELFS